MCKSQGHDDDVHNVRQEIPFDSNDDVARPTPTLAQMYVPSYDDSVFCLFLQKHKLAQRYIPRGHFP